MNAAYAQLRGEPRSDDPEPIDEGDTKGGGADAVADNLARIGFISSDASRGRNPAVEVLASLLPEGSRIHVCLTCLGVRANGHIECRETSGTFGAVTVTRQDGPYATGDSVHPIARTEIVLCTGDELSWTVSKYAGHRTDEVTLYAIPFDDIVGAQVRNRKRDIVEVWIADGPTISIQTRPRQGDALCDYIERAATSK